MLDPHARRTHGDMATRAASLFVGDLKSQSHSGFGLRRLESIYKDLRILAVVVHGCAEISVTPGSMGQAVVFINCYSTYWDLCGYWLLPRTECLTLRPRGGDVNGCLTATDGCHSPTGRSGSATSIRQRSRATPLVTNHGRVHRCPLGKGAGRSRSRSRALFGGVRSVQSIHFISTSCQTPCPNLRKNYVGPSRIDQADRID